MPLLDVIILFALPKYHMVPTLLLNREFWSGEVFLGSTHL